jgi:hypothetical protein
MMAGKSGMLNDGGKVSFGKSREQCLLRVKKKQPVSAFSAAVDGDEDEVYKLLCLEKLTVDERNPFNGRTLLHEAAAFNHLSLATMLLETFNANINCRSYLGKETPLHLAVAQDSRPMVYLLLNHGADPNIQSKYMSTPLHYCKKRSIAVLLTRAGGQTTTRNIHAMTPVQCVTAELDDCDELVDFLTNVNQSQDRENYKKERDANRAQREEVERLKREAYLRSNGGKKATFKEKMMKEYEKWRKGDDEFLEGIEKRKVNQAKKPNEYFEDPDWRLRPPPDHSTTNGDIPPPRMHAGF